MYHLAESLRISAVLLQPFLTQTPEKMFAQLGVEDQSLKAWDSIQTFGQLKNAKVKKGEPLFPRLEAEEEVAYIKQKMQGTAPSKEEKAEEPQEAERLPEITFDQFMDTELRVAEVLSAEPVKKADRLLKLQIDLGFEQRQVVSGIAKHYTPDQLVGMKIICVTNLKPVKLRGELSQGMILAGESDGVLKVVVVDQSLPKGTRIK